MSFAESQARQAAQQAALVRALTGQGNSPPGFATSRIETAAAALLRKRIRSVARAWPGLAAALGERFAERFAAFARETPLPRLGGPLADGRAFAQVLASAGDLPDAGRLEAFVVNLRQRSTADGLIPRRGLRLQAIFLRSARRLVVAARLPWLGERCVSLPPWHRSR
jgi:hypothetical protein